LTHSSFSVQVYEIDLSEAVQNPQFTKVASITLPFEANHLELHRDRVLAAGPDDEQEEPTGFWVLIWDYKLNHHTAWWMDNDDCEDVRRVRCVDLT